MKIALVLQLRQSFKSFLCRLSSTKSKEEVFLKFEVTSAVSLMHTPDYRLSGSLGKLFVCILGQESCRHNLTVAVHCTSFASGALVFHFPVSSKFK